MDKPDYGQFLGPNMDRVCRALDGSGDQKRIADVGIATVATLLRKNADYGSSVFRSPVLLDGLDAGSAILVRLGDKFERLQRLANHSAEVEDETLKDTMKDVAGYAILYLVSIELEELKEKNG